MAQCVVAQISLCAMVVTEEVVGGGVTVTVNVVKASSMVLECGSHRCVQ